MNLPEGEEIPHVRAVDDFLNAAMADLEVYLHSLPDNKPKDWTPLEDFFLAELRK